LLLLELRLLLLVLFESLLALVTRQLAMWRPLRHALRLGTRSRTLGCDSVTFDHADVLGIRIRTTAHVGRFDLPIDGVFVLAARVAPDADLTTVVLVVHVQLAGRGISDHAHVGTAARVVLLAVVSRELVLVL